MSDGVSDYNKACEEASLRARLETAERERDEARLFLEQAQRHRQTHYAKISELNAENRLLREALVKTHGVEMPWYPTTEQTTAEVERVKRLERFWETAKVIFVNDAVSAHQIEDAWVDFGEALDALAGEVGVSEDSG